jgi:exopolysaccharide biosynthesis glucuronosyltransferase PssE
VIFLTVGTQLPFDRLVRAVDEWAGRTGRTDVVAQTGPANYVPVHLSHRPFISPAEFASYAANAELIVSHAGMGTILSALGRGKPIVVMPRLAALGEHRNDHQLATAHKLRELRGIQVAMDETELVALLNGAGAMSTVDRIGPYASKELLACVSHFIRD